MSEKPTYYFLPYQKSEIFNSSLTAFRRQIQRCWDRKLIIRPDQYARIDRTRISLRQKFGIALPEDVHSEPVSSDGRVPAHLRFMFRVQARQATRLYAQRKGGCRGMCQ